MPTAPVIHPAVAAAAPQETAPAGFPVGDWQFWVVTTIALVAAIWLLRRLLPKRLFSAHRRPVKPATLTIAGKAVVREGKRADCHRS